MPQRLELTIQCPKSAASVQESGVILYETAIDVLVNQIGFPMSIFPDLTTDSDQPTALENILSESKDHWIFFLPLEINSVLPWQFLHWMNPATQLHSNGACQTQLRYFSGENKPLTRQTPYYREP
jgi:hypothetical protein